MEAELRVKALTEQELFDLPVTVDIETAGRGFGMGRTKAQKLAREDNFPCQVLPSGRSRIVTKVALLTALGYTWSASGWSAPSAAA